MGNLHRRGGSGLIEPPRARMPSLSRYAAGLLHAVVVCLALTACVAPRAHHRQYRMALSRVLIEDAEAHLKRGEAFERAGKLQLAYEEYRAAFAENPFQDSALLKRDLVRLKILAAAVPKDPAANAIEPRSAPPASNEPVSSIVNE